MSLSAPPGCVADPWLSNVLGAPCATLPVDATPDAPPEGWFVTAKTPAGDVRRAAQLQALGFRLVDVAVTFRGAPKTAMVSDPRVREAKPQDEAAVRAVAGRSFHSTRFHLDPTVPRTLADRVKEAWAANYFSGSRGDALIVASVEPDAPPIGFLQILLREGCWIIDLIAVAPEAARQGLARAMIDAGRAAYPDRDILVGTQAANAASLALYQSLGLSLWSLTSIQHFHGATLGPHAR